MVVHQGAPYLLMNIQCGGHTSPCGQKNFLSSAWAGRNPHQRGRPVIVPFWPFPATCELLAVIPLRSAVPLWPWPLFSHDLMVSRLRRLLLFSPQIPDPACLPVQSKIYVALLHSRRVSRRSFGRFPFRPARRTEGRPVLSRP